MKVWRKSAAFLLGMLLMFSAFGAAFAAGEEETPLREQAAQALQKAAAYVGAQSQVSEWGVIGLARGGFAVPAKYLSDVENIVRQAEGVFSRVTDYERMSLGVLAAGGDPRDVAGHDLLELILNDARLDRQGPNGIIYALLLLSSGGFDEPADAVWTKEKLIAWLINAQNEDGGWPIAPGGESNADITAMALAALAPVSDQEEVQAAIDQAVSHLAGIQRSDGGFPQLSAERTAQVIIGLAANGIDAAAGAFAKEEGNALSYLLSLQQADGSFAHLPGGGPDMMASEQALMALVAYDLLLKGQTGLFEGLRAAEVKVRIEGPEGLVGSGTARGLNALEALENWARATGMSLDKTVYAFGTSVDAVDGIASGLYGGWDGWFYAVKRDGTWIHPQSAIDGFALENGDELVLYYSDMTKLVRDIDVSPLVPQSGQPFAVKVTTSESDWETGAEIVLPAANVRVTIGDQSAVTDEDGTAHFSGLSSRTYAVQVDGFREGAAPSVVRAESELYVAPATLADFRDADAVSEWAREGVDRAIGLGFMKGTSRDEPVFAPKRAMTRAEFAVLLTSLVSLDPSSGAGLGYSDVKPSDWYAAAVEILGENGVLESAPSFRPHERITREEMGVWTAKALGLHSSEERDDLRDLERASVSSRPYIQAVFEHGLIVGNNGYYRPLDQVTREEAALVAIRIYQLQHNESERE